MKNNISMSLLLLLASIFAMSPFAIDSYLSAIPVIADDLNTQTSLVAVTVSIYILGLAMGQLLGGPLSDRWGRRPSTILGLLVFAIGSVLLANVQSIEMLWIWRIVQSIGGGIAVVNVPAIIRDNAIGKEAARLFSLIALIMMIAPAIAPTIGTVILHTLSWHWIFIMLSLVAVIVAIAAFRIMPDTKRAKKVKPSGGFLSVLKERRALGYLIAQGFGYAVMMTFIANAPFAYIEHFHVSPELFSGLFIANVVVVVIINRLNSLLLHRYEPPRLLKAFLSLQLLGGMILVSSMIMAPDNLWFAVIGFILCASSNAGILPNASVSFMHYFEKNSGIASALLGAVQYGTAAAVSALAAILTTDSLWPMILTMLTSTLIALTAAIIAAQDKTDGNIDTPLLRADLELIRD